MGGQACFLIVLGFVLHFLPRCIIANPSLTCIRMHPEGSLIIAFFPG